MSALRLEVETHIVTASATAVQNLTKCVAAAGRQDRRARGRLARVGRGGPVRDREGARRRGRRHRRRDDRPRPLPGRLAVPHPGPAGRRRQRHQRRRDRPQDEHPGRRGAQDQPRDVRPARIDEDEQISVSVLGEDAGRTVSRLEVSQIIEARMRETFELLRNEIRAAGVGMLPAGIILTGGGVAARRRRRARPRGPPDAGPHRRPGGDRRAGRHAAQPELQHGRRAPPVGRHSLTAGEPTRYESAPAGGGLGRLRDAIRSIFP